MVILTTRLVKKDKKNKKQCVLRCIGYHFVLTFFEKNKIIIFNKQLKLHKYNKLTKMDNRQIDLTLMNYGTSSQDMLQRHMIKLEVEKLQLINAESQLQVQIDLFQEQNLDKNKVQPNSQLMQAQKAFQQENLSQQQIQEALIEKFSLLLPEKKKELKQKFQAAKSYWETYSINQFLSNPRYLFMSGNQPCFVFYQVNMEKMKKLRQPEAQTIRNYFPNSSAEVLFYILLCLNDSNRLSKRLVQMILQKSSLISRLIRFGMNKSFENQKAKIQRERSKYHNEKCQKEQKEQKEQIQPESKKIGKIKKIAKIVKEPKIQSSEKRVQEYSKKSQQIISQNDKEKEDKRLDNYKGLEKIIQKLVGFTMLSYTYVIDQEIKLRTKLESLQSYIKIPQPNAQKDKIQQ